MQIGSPTSLDPAITQAQVQNQIDVAVALKAQQVEKQQGEAALEMIKQVAQVSQQLASGHIDVTL